MSENTTSTPSPDAPRSVVDRLGRAAFRLWQRAATEIQSEDGAVRTVQSKLRELGTRTFSPLVDIAETDAGYEILADTPGLARGDLDVDVVDGVLRIAGTRRAHDASGDVRMCRVERRYGDFKRTFPVPDGLRDGVEVKLQRGVLRVTVPKRVAPATEGDPS